MKKIFIFLLLVVLSLSVFYYVWLTPKYVVPILTYHNISYEKGGFFVSPENFTRQMEYLKTNGYDVIALDELVNSIKNKKALKRNKVVITFDDGYEDNFEYAYPVLKRLNFDVTIFIIADFMGRISKKNEKKFLDWDKVIEMSKNGVSFGAHTKSHMYLGTAMSDNLALEEISGSKKMIEEITGVPVKYFCYPLGGFNKRIKELVQQAGYKGACTTNRGFAKFNSDVFELKRIKVTNADGEQLFKFWIKLSGYYNILRREKNSN